MALCKVQVPWQSSGPVWPRTSTSSSIARALRRWARSCRTRCEQRSETDVLQIGERLPSSRKLAVDLGVSRGLAQATYEQLEAEGYLRAIGGSATRVAFSPRATGHITNAPPPARMEIDFAPGRPDLNSFPARDWLWAWGGHPLASARDMGYCDPQGSICRCEGHRVVPATCSRRIRRRGRRGDLQRVHPGTALTLAALRASGATSVAVEDPGHLDMPILVGRAGLNPVFVPVDDRGLVIDELARTNATTAIVTPAHRPPPAWSSPLSGGWHCCSGPSIAGRRWGSRTITTRSSATTSSPSGRSRDSRRIAS